MKSIVTVCCIALFVCFLSGRASASVVDEPVTLAVIAAKTGEAATSNEVLFQTVRFAVDEINASGGLLGKTLRVIEFDNQSSAIGSLEAAQTVAHTDAAVVIGASWSSHSLAMGPVLQRAGIPMITPISTNPDVTLAGNYIFRACYTDPFQGRVMARFALTYLKAETAVTLVNISRTYSVGLAEVFETAFRKIGGTMMWRGEFLLDESDFSGLLDKVEKLDPDVMYVPGDYRDSSYIIKQARERGIRAIILGADAFGMRLYDYIGELAHGVYYTTNWHRESTLPESIDFVRRYEASFGSIRQTTVPLTYDSVMLWAQAVREAGSFDRKTVRDALADLRGYAGVTGNFSFDNNGDPIKPVVINRLEDNDVVFIMNAKP